MCIIIEEYTILNDSNSPSTNLLILPWYSSQENTAQGKAVYPESTSTIIKLLQEKAIVVELAEGDFSNIILEDRHSNEWFGPTILFPLVAIYQNPEIVTITLNIISHYLSNILFGDRVSKSEPVAKLDIIIQNTKSAKRIKYDGHVSGLHEIQKIVQAMNNE